MTLLLKQLFSLFKLLNSDHGENSIAAGLALGVILGFAPIISLQFILVLILCFFFRIQLGAAFISAFFFKIFAWTLGPAADVLGQSILENEGLRPLLTELYNMPLLPMTRFNNSVIMGSLVISIVLSLPLFFIFKSMIIKYRSSFIAKYKESKVWKAFAATKFYGWYSKYNELYG